MWEMQKRGHETIITARRKESTFQLLDYYGFDFIDIGVNKKGLFKKAVGLAQNDYKIYKISKKFNPDALVGFASPYITHVGKFIRKKSVLFNDTEHAALNNKLSIPFSDYFLTPSCFMGDCGNKHIKFNGYKELAYLHPNWFREERNVLKDLGIGKKEPYSLVRVVSWEASHDVGYKGISKEELLKLIRLLEDHGKVLLSSESNNKSFEEYQIKVHPAKIHTLMNRSSLYIGEGATMATEAAVLGKPSIYISPLVGTMGNFIELEKYGLLFSYKTIRDSFSKIQEIIESDYKNEWKEKKEKLLCDKIDITAFMIDFFESKFNM
jgi:predicted glycosyltransferase